ncbi:unnamed protein product [Cylindrotheca closterium]|uniref:Uncharacterized protein n=1 Tax=Cylindrotheca closterium TaxID=2856 RepID=A0AAD2CI25_9STRA|nr:unnamed protein product [Cylindrotheca closterium]
MNTFGIKSTRRNIKDDLKTAEQRRQGGQRQALIERNRAKFDSLPLNAGPFVYSPFPVAIYVSSESDCRDATAGDNIEAEMMETYLALHPSLEIAASSKVDASVADLPKRFSCLSVDCNAMEVDQDEMDIDLPEIVWMQVDIDEMEVDLPSIDWMDVDGDDMNVDGPY